MNKKLLTLLAGLVFTSGTYTAVNAYTFWEDPFGMKATKERAEKEVRKKVDLAG